jgi:hypothetical protein
LNRLGRRTHRRAASPHPISLEGLDQNLTKSNVGAVPPDKEKVAARFPDPKRLPARIDYNGTGSFFTKSLQVVALVRFQEISHVPDASGFIKR